MRYSMRQKLFSFGDRFTIKEESREVFVVEGKVFNVGDKLSFKDLSGKEL